MGLVVGGLSEIWLIWAKLGVCAGAIAVAGTLLTRYADVIAEKTGWSGSWVGLVLLASVTSLPELVTGVSAVSLAGAPNIAIGDVLGSLVFNLLILALIDALSRSEPLYRSATQSHVLSAAWGVVLMGIVAMALVLAQTPAAPSIGHIGLYSPLFVLGYLLAVRSVFLHERSQMPSLPRGAVERYPGTSLRQASMRYAAAAVIVVGASIWLPFVGVELATQMGWQKSFVGTLFVAAATSLPELVVTITALRMGALDMAVGNLLGSNLFDIAIIAIDDMFYTPGPILSAVSPLHASTAVAAMTMSAIAIVALRVRATQRVFGLVGGASIALLAVYLFNAWVLFHHAS
jgi:cation:H+ antiporter